MLFLWHALYTLFLLFLILYLLRKFIVNSIVKIPCSWILGFFTFKFFIGILLTLLYTYYYDSQTADIYKYFNDGKIMYNALYEKPSDFLKMIIGWESNEIYFRDNYYTIMNNWTRSGSDYLPNDSRLMIRLNALFHIFSFGNIYVHTLLINLFSFAGVLLIYKSLLSFFYSKEKLLFVVLCLTPSLLFWGSGLLKESLIVFGLGCVFYAFFNTSKKIIRILIFLLGIWIIYQLKFYLIPIILFSLSGYFLANRISIKPLFAYLLSYSLGGVITFILILIYPELNPLNFLISKQQEFLTLISEENPKSGFLIAPIDSYYDAICSIPNAFINTLVRPYPWESNSVLHLISFLENLLLLSFLVYAFINRQKDSYNKSFLLLVLTFSLSLYLIIGWTVPIFGAIVRYKSLAVLFVVIAGIYILPSRKQDLQNGQ